MFCIELLERNMHVSICRTLTNGDFAVEFLYNNNNN